MPDSDTMSVRGGDRGDHDGSAEPPTTVFHDPPCFVDMPTDCDIPVDISALATSPTVMAWRTVRDRLESEDKTACWSVPFEDLLRIGNQHISTAACMRARTVRALKVWALVLSHKFSESGTPWRHLVHHDLHDHVVWDIWGTCGEGTPSDFLEIVFNAWGPLVRHVEILDGCTTADEATYTTTSTLRTSTVLDSAEAVRQHGKLCVTEIWTYTFDRVTGKICRYVCQPGADVIDTTLRAVDTLLMDPSFVESSP